MFLRVETSGAKLWRMQYRFGGKSGTAAFGKYPEVTLAAARDKRQQSKTQIANGIDPAQVLNTYADCWLALECGKRGLSKPWINGPQGEDLHGGSHHATLPYLGPKNRVTELGIDRLVDALSWLTYIYKARDKHDEEWKGQGRIFAAARPTRSKQVTILADERQQADSGLVIKVKTGDDLLDKMIAETQRRYWPLCAAVGAALH